MFKRRVKRWMTLLLLAALAFGIGRGCDCADPERNRVDRPPTGTVGAAPGAVALRAAQDAKAAPRSPRAEAGGRVLRVRDGDSIAVQRDGVGIEVRLDGIDCPELAQAFGWKAKQYTSDLVLGKAVRLVEKGRDKYGRVLAEVFLADGRSLNRELVAAGSAWWYRKHSSDRGLEALEREARAARRGLWATQDPVPPWDFRADERR